MTLKAIFMFFLFAFSPSSLDIRLICSIQRKPLTWCLQEQNLLVFLVSSIRIHPCSTLRHFAVNNAWLEVN